MPRPNRSQQQTIGATERPILIIAGPGSGKAFTSVDRLSPPDRGRQKAAQDAALAQSRASWFLCRRAVGSPQILAGGQNGLDYRLCGSCRWRVVAG
jgi:hypothetical protein